MSWPCKVQEIEERVKENDQETDIPLRKFTDQHMNKSIESAATPVATATEVSLELSED